MKILFRAIRRGDLEEMRRILDKYPHAIRSVATAPPKKDVGQSPLQVAVKSDHLEAAHFLLDRGADVHFLEQAVYHAVDLRAPVLYDAVGQLFLGWYAHRSAGAVARAEGYCALICRLLELGADPNQEDSCGSAAWNWVLEGLAGTLRWTDSPTVMERDAAIVDVAGKVLAQLAAHGADIFHMPGGKELRQVIYNLSCARDILDGAVFRNEADEKDENYRWRLMEPVLRPFYAAQSLCYRADAPDAQKSAFAESMAQSARAAAEAARARRLAHWEYLRANGLLSPAWYARERQDPERARQAAIDVIMEE